MSQKGRTQERGVSFIYPGISTPCKKKKKSVNISMDSNYPLVINKMLLTVGFKTDPYKKIHQ